MATWKGSTVVPGNPLSYTDKDWGNTQNLGVLKEVFVHVPNSPKAVVVFFGGFLAPAAWYKPLMQRLASAGYVTVQYDTNTILDDVLERRVLEPLLTWLKDREELRDKLDLDKLALAGHSRGGKLAILHCSQGPGVKIKNVYLVDPVFENFMPNENLSETLRRAGEACHHLKLEVIYMKERGAFNPGLVELQNALNGINVRSHMIEGKHLAICDANSANPVLAMLDHFVIGEEASIAFVTGKNAVLQALAHDANPWQFFRHLIVASVPQLLWTLVFHGCCNIGFPDRWANHVNEADLARGPTLEFVAGRLTSGLAA